MGQQVLRCSFYKRRIWCETERCTSGKLIDLLFFHAGDSRLRFVIRSMPWWFHAQRLEEVSSEFGLGGRVESQCGVIGGDYRIPSGPSRFC